MSNMNKKDHDRWYPLIMAKQGGEYCVMCGLTIKQLINNGQSGKLCIDHINNNNSINEIENFQFLCKSCNTIKNHPKNIEPFERLATPEMIKGKKFEKDFRRWVQGFFMVDPHCGLEYSFLINSGAEKVECSTETIKRYLNKMTSKEGMYEWIDKFGSTVLVLKDEYI